MSAAEAVRIALAAQGLAAPPDPAPASAARLRRLVDRLGLLQIDSVNVLARAHYLPPYARLSNYAAADLDALVAARPKRLFEYWGHEASLLPVDLHPLLRWRMARARSGQGIWTRLGAYAHQRRAEADALLARIETDGPLAASDVAGSRVSKGMWAWSDAKHALEWLFWSGLLAASHRRASFERVYDLPERVLPRTILQRPTPTETDAIRTLVARSAKALGVATLDDLRDHFRLPAAEMRAPLAQLVADGTLRPVRVHGWRQLAYLHRDARAIRRPAGATLLSPFDPLVWHRPRTERLFGFRYRLEIYTPAHRREHGYYVLPFLLDGALVARVDLKADRRAGELLVRRSHLEPDAPRSAPERLAGELRRLAAWLGLAEVVTETHPTRP